MSQTAVAEKPADTQIQPLLEKYFQVEEYAYGTYSVMLPAGTPIDNLFRPEFWVNIAPRLKGNPMDGAKPQVGACIVVRTEDHAFKLRLYVMAVSEGGLDVKIEKQDENGIIWLVTPEVYASEGAAGYRVRHNVNARGWDVIRESDKKIVSPAKDNQTKESALNWIAEARKAA